eukprot:snap_masked-scaffold_1-processed-gene-13.32-mRNA-1 protein AED:1.00 eAED:1.00 QI:0/-1/0/0/-1/1/1/0/80
MFSQTLTVTGFIKYVVTCYEKCMIRFFVKLNKDTLRSPVHIGRTRKEMLKKSFTAILNYEKEEVNQYLTRTWTVSHRMDN